MFNVIPNTTKPSQTKRQNKPHSFAIKGFSMALLIGCTLLNATGCQKTEEPPVIVNDVSNANESDVGATTVPDNNDTAAPMAKKVNGSQTPEKNSMRVEQEETVEHQNMSAAEKETTSLEASKKQRIDEQTDPSLAANKLSADESDVFLEKQITAVEYRNNSGHSIKVTFQTSALEALEANVLLPSGKRILLTAPKDEGNNPTYRSSDGSIELVTHGGGGSIDLVSKGKSSSFDAVSAEAEVIAPPK